MRSNWSEQSRQQYLAEFGITLWYPKRELENAPEFEELWFEEDGASHAAPSTGQPAERQVATASRGHSEHDEAVASAAISQLMEGMEVSSPDQPRPPVAQDTHVVTPTASPSAQTSLAVEQKVPVEEAAVQQQDTDKSATSQTKERQPPAADPEQEISSLTLLRVITPGAVMVAELGGEEKEGAHSVEFALMQNIANAVSLSSASRKPEQFVWPPLRHPDLPPPGEEVFQQALQLWMQTRGAVESGPMESGTMADHSMADRTMVDRSRADRPRPKNNDSPSTRVLLLFGRLKIVADASSSMNCLQLPTLTELVENPALKRDVWNRLKPHVYHA